MLPASQLPPPRFAVQSPKGKRWETLFLDEDEAKAQQAFRTLVAAHRKKVIRLIRVEFDSPDESTDFRWRLVRLYDPRKMPGAQNDAAGKAEGPREHVGIPLKVYLLALLFGLVAGAIVFYLYSPARL